MRWVRLQTRLCACNSQLSHTLPACIVHASPSVHLRQHSHVPHLYACLEGKGGPAHSLPAFPEVAMCQQIRSNMACSAAGRFWRAKFRENFDIIVLHALMLKPGRCVPRCESKHPRTASSSKSTAGARGHIKTRQSSFVICVCTIRHFSWTSTCFFGSGPIYVWERPPCISPTAPPSEKPRPDLATSFAL